jgi:hypothetical protein
MWYLIARNGVIPPLATGDEVGNGEGIRESIVEDIDAENLSEEDQPRRQQHRNN